MGAMLFGVSPRDPVTYAGIVALTLAVFVPAMWVPARRAMHVAPLQNLKQA
jgi:hypothetical protein